ncbi:VOC family protein [Asaia prunellae]|uniref:VOC family protein n=1 Tax=Asaia prunellae TaxID=610245 RepID=UPI0004724785|nr:VOC family protein [Asaia prunellae]
MVVGYAALSISQAAAGYYQLLFNYKIVAAPEADSAQHYLLMSQDKERASVNTLPTGVEQRDHARWVQFVEVSNSAIIAEKAQALGGQIIVPTHVDRDGAQIAILADPNGAVFGVIESQKDMLEGTLSQ